MDFFWKTYGKLVESVFNDATRLCFCEKNIDCYFDENKSFSSPLTIKITDVEKMENNLLHELIHILFTQNYEVNKIFRKKWDRYWNSKNFYPHITNVTRSHIPVHALHFLVTEKLFPYRTVSYDSTDQNYKQSWDIVLYHGPKNILDTLFL